MTPEQIDLVFQVLFGHRARQADIGIVQAMGATRDQLADYIWDHWMGEPDEPTVTELRSKIDQILA